jgi:LysM repeat protein
MNALRQAMPGVIAALVSSLLVAGSLLASLGEGEGVLALLPSLTPTATLLPPPTRPIPTPAPGEPTFTASPSATLTEIPSPTATPTPRCAYPEGWVPIIVQPGDTLRSLARTYGISPDELAEANCLIGNTLVPDTTLYVPPLPPASSETPAPTAEACGPPAGWVVYIVQPGDTLFRLSQTLGVTVGQLQRANCLGGSTLLKAGQRLYVPFLPVSATRTPTPTPTPSRSPAPSATPRPSQTPSEPPVSSTPSQTPRPPSSTPTESLPPSATPTLTPQPSDTPQPTTPPPPPSPTPTQEVPTLPVPTATSTLPSQEPSPTPADP